MLTVDILTEYVHPNLSKMGLWVFLELYNEPRELYFLTCTAFVGFEKLAESTYMICVFWSVTLVVGFSVRERENRAPEFGERLGKSGV